MNSKTPQKGKGINQFGILVAITALSSLTYFPFIFDGYSLPKILVLSAGLALLIFNLVVQRVVAGWQFKNNLVVSLCVLIIILIVLSSKESKLPFLRSSFGSYGRGNGIFYYISVFTLLILAMAYVNSKSLISLESQLKIFSWVLVLYGLIQFVGLDFVTLETKGLLKVVLTYGNSNFAGGMLAVLFTFHFILEIQKTNHKFIDFVLIGLLLVTTYITQATQGLLIEIFSGAVGFTFLLARKIHTKQIKLSLILIWIIGITTSILGMLSIGPIASVFNEYSFRLRKEYWVYGLKIIKDSPLLGVGPDNIYDNSAQFFQVDSLNFQSQTRVDNVHNWFIQFGASFGIIALLALLMIIGIVLYSGFKHIIYSSQSSPVFIALYSMFIALIIIGFVSIEQPGLGVWFYLLAGVILGSSRKVDNEVCKVNLPTTFFNAFFAGMLLIISFLTAQMIYKDWQLRSVVQEVTLGRVAETSVSELIEKSSALRSQPEYQTKSLDLLAKMGNSQGMNQVSETHFNFFPTSLVNQYIRVAVLKALDRPLETCDIRPLILARVPFDLEQWFDYIHCAPTSIDESQASQLITKISPYLEYDLSKAEPDSYEQVRDLQIKAFNAWLLNDIQNLNLFVDKLDSIYPKYLAITKSKGGQTDERLIRVDGILKDLAKR
jgi:O-antigen ligase